MDREADGVRISLRNIRGLDAALVRSAVVRRVSTTVVLLGMVSPLTDVSSEMASSVLPLYLTAQVGLTMTAYGFLGGRDQGASAAACERPGVYRRSI